MVTAVALRERIASVRRANDGAQPSSVWVTRASHDELARDVGGMLRDGKPYQAAWSEADNCYKDPSTGATVLTKFADVNVKIIEVIPPEQGRAKAGRTSNAA